jgi:hypothetical protein
MMQFLLSFLVFIVIVAILIIGFRWLLSLTGLAIPQPLLIILGLILFLVLIFVFFNYVGGASGVHLGAPFTRP